MCGEDGIKRVVYNMKKGYAGRGSEDRVKKKDSRRNIKKKKNCIYSKEKKPMVISTLILEQTRGGIFLLRRRLI